MARIFLRQSITPRSNGGLMKYKDWLTQWLENYVYPSVKVRTFERYKLIVERHIKEKLGGTELSELSLLALQSFITELLRDGNKKTGVGLAANSVNSVISVIQSSLKTAHLLGLTKEYTADKLKRPKLTEKPVECFTLAEQKRIEQAIMSGKKWRRRNRGQKIIRTSAHCFGSYYSDLVHQKTIKKNTVILQVNKLDYYCQVELPLLNK